MRWFVLFVPLCGQQIDVISTGRVNSTVQPGVVVARQDFLEGAEWLIYFTCWGSSSYSVRL